MRKNLVNFNLIYNMCFDNPIAGRLHSVSSFGPVLASTRIVFGWYYMWRGIRGGTVFGWYYVRRGIQGDTVHER